MEIDQSKYYIEEEQIPEDDNLSSILSVKIEDLPSPSKCDELDALTLRVEETIGDSLAKEKCGALTVPNSQFSPPSIDQFLRNYLQENGFLETLNVFQAEWFKLLHKGLLNTEESPVADIYLQNNELRNSIKDIRSENLDLKNSVLKLEDELRKIKNERDYHMIKHRQTLQDKEKLLCDIKRVKEHYAEYEPILRLLRQKYETAMKEKTLHRIERDRAMNQVEGLRHALTSLQKLGITSNDLNDVDNLNMDQSMPEKKITNVQVRQSNVGIDQKCKKIPIKTEEFILNSKLGKSVKRTGFCDLSIDRKVNPLLAKLTNHSYKFIRLDNRKLDMSIHAHDATVSKFPRSTNDWLSSVDFHPQEEILATGNGKGCIQIWKIHLTDDKMTEQNHCKRIGLLRQHAGAVWSINWHWTGTYLASSGMDNTIRLWNVEYAIMSYKMNKNLLSTHPTTSYCTILRGHSKSVNSVQFLPYGNILVTGSSDKTVCLWDGRTGLCEHTFLGHTHSINNAIFNQQGVNVISCDSGGYIRLWDLRKMEKFSFETNLPTITTKIHQNLMSTSTISVNNNKNDVENNNFPICFDLNKTQKIDRFNRHPHVQPPSYHHHHPPPPPPVSHHQNVSILQRNKMGINQLAVDLSSEYIVAGCDDAKIYCIEISTGQISTLQGHDDSIQSIVLDYVTGYLYSSSTDQKICSWI
ncbi:hypothetical protein MN116_004577 [Schistosoma mekongi]|uniref:Sperm-associated antigen 16 protein n=1 Tax=Schistosoma mekongi TaxID=38744 RepID=A0AAE1ZDS7_SCHME|nr:hypothetical protein MN116_004577 [Schistosoma mekongi]